MAWMGSAACGELHADQHGDIQPSQCCDFFRILFWSTHRQVHTPTHQRVPGNVVCFPPPSCQSKQACRKQLAVVSARMAAGHAARGHKKRRRAGRLALTAVPLCASGARPSDSLTAQQVATTSSSHNFGRHLLEPYPRWGRGRRRLHRSIHSFWLFFSSSPTELTAAQGLPFALA